ncbi:MAG: hypothetical protein QNL68_15615 [Akkermansiaceae bacterium]
MQPFSLPNHDTVLNWRASGASTTGSSNSTIFSGTTSAELLTYATNDISPTITKLSDGRVEFTVTINQLADDLIGELQLSNNLLQWDLNS